MEKPFIGIVPLVDVEKDSYWMLPGYMKGIELGGGIPVVLPLTSGRAILRQLAARLDGFVFTGGQDVSPLIYHETPREACGTCCPERDSMETALLQLILELDKPLLGICRGLQLINAALGGTLYQDLSAEHPSDVLHHQAPPYDRPSHTVRLLQDTPLQHLLEKEKLAVNSYHHQAVKLLSPELLPMACSEDGLVEAAWLPAARFVWAVQWHPEFSFRTDEDSMKLFKQLIRASQNI